ncbi:MAG: SHOCT domain-containing protein [Spirochaetaceae bacterium]|nr:SHOCT domain-containing protein [Spirochaetaceae bacterium]
MYTFINRCPIFNNSYGGLVMMIFGIVLIGIVVYIILRGNEKSRLYSRDKSVEDPIEILKQRYAKGLINKEEFLKMKEELNK